MEPTNAKVLLVDDHKSATSHLLNEGSKEERQATMSTDQKGGLTIWLRETSAR
jgi:hypothetical protein